MFALPIALCTENMLKKLACLLAYLCLSCQSSVPEQKKGSSVAKTIKQESVLVSKKASKDTLPETISEIWNVIKQKAKLPFTNEWKVPEQYNPELTCVKMTPQEFVQLGLQGIYKEDGKTLFPSNFFHSHKIFQDFIALVIVIDSGIYTYCLELLTYNKAGKLIDHTTIGLHGGDAGEAWSSKTRFLKEDNFVTTYELSNFPLPNQRDVYYQSIQNISLTKAGKFSKSPLQTTIDKPRKNWDWSLLEKERENEEKLSKKDTL
jgi:hypothetical protein